MDKFTSPIHLTASTVISSNSSGGVNALSLKNPIAHPMEILEIKWRLDVAENNNVGSNNLGGIIACKLDLGKFPLTNGFVPIWSFGRSINLSNEVFNNNGTVSSVSQAASEYTWRLPRPLYIPSSAVLVPNFQHRGLTQNSVTVRVSYSGRTLPLNAPKPKKLVLPYVAAYISKTFTGDEAGTDQSTETDLINPFNEPVNLQCFSGRGLTINNSNVIARESGFGLNAGIDRALTVRMVDSSGRPLIRNFTRFRTAFSAMTRSWEMGNGATMDPNSFYSAFLKFADLGSFTANTYLFQAFIGLTGWRDVSAGEVK